jgi:hypothetical protein
MMQVGNRRRKQVNRMSTNDVIAPVIASRCALSGARVQAARSLSQRGFHQ